MKKIALCIALALITLTSGAKEKEEIKVTPISADADAANNGLIYALPQTVIRVRIEAELSIKKAGPYYKYSNKYLNLSDVITENSKTWKIVSADIETIGNADNSRRFKITSSGCNLPAVNLESDGHILGINLPFKHGRHKDIDQSCDKQSRDIKDISFDDIRLDKSILTKTSTASMAEETAITIYKLREKRMALLGGDESTILNDEGSYKQVLKQLEKQEDDLLSLFVGKEEIIKVVKYFDVTPNPTGESSVVLLRFSESEGFLNAMDLAGKPVYVDFVFNSNNRVNEYSEQSKQRKAEPLTGFRYIIPGTVNVKVIDRKTLLTEKTCFCAQNGQIATLPAQLLTDKSVSIRLDSSTGALIGIDYNSSDSKNNKWEKK